MNKCGLDVRDAFDKARDLKSEMDAYVESEDAVSANEAELAEIVSRGAKLRDEYKQLVKDNEGVVAEYDAERARYDSEFEVYRQGCNQRKIDEQLYTDYLNQLRLDKDARERGVNVPDRAKVKDPSKGKYPNAPDPVNENVFGQYVQFLQSAANIAVEMALLNVREGEVRRTGRMLVKESDDASGVLFDRYDDFRVSVLEVVHRRNVEAAAAKENRRRLADNARAQIKYAEETLRRLGVE